MKDKIDVTNEHLINELNQVRREVTVLYEVSHALRMTLDLENIMYIILTGVTSHSGLGFNRAILFLVNSKERRLEPKMAIGPESGEHAKKIWEYISISKPRLEDLITNDTIDQNVRQSALFKKVQHLSIPLNIDNPNLLAQAYHNGDPMLLRPNEIDNFYDDELFQNFQSDELVLMPLKAKDSVNGIIIADNTFTHNPITEHDLKIFSMLANQAGLAIENSQLYELMKNKSQQDSLTELWNHGFFQYQLDKEMEYASDNEESLSLIIMDIDNFKELNDTYGHQVGDVVLKEISELIKESSRDIDYVCRYGGEEFSIILPQTTKEQSHNIAERIRQRIEQHSFTRIFADDESKSITVSVGSATIPNDAHSKEELIAKADKAMYIAKFSGKNRTCLAS